MKRSRGVMYNVSIHPKAQSVIAMTLASALHFSGYEFARSSVLAMFTSHRTGFSNPSALPFATGCVAPFSICLLMIYTKILSKSGPQKALRYSTLFCACMFSCGGLMLTTIDEYLDDDLIPSEAASQRNIYHSISRVALFFMYVLQSGFVQLLYTQHWSFLGSIQSREEGAVWFSLIAGIASISSTLAAFSVAPLVATMGLGGLLYAAASLLILSAMCGDWAYNVADQYGFEPRKVTEQKSSKKKSSSTDQSLLLTARRLFRRVPVLGALCSEVLGCQCLSSLISFLYMMQVKESIADDEKRAAWTGNCYAWINGVSGVIQFFALPLLVKHIDTRSIWLFMPLVMMCFTMFLGLQPTVSLELITASFFAMKTMEYSLRGVANEMVYVSLDYESRFVGKEIVGLFANRLGKSFMAVSLSAITAAYGSDSGMFCQIAMASSCVSACWFAASFRLTKLVDISNPTKGKRTLYGKSDR